MGSVWHGLHLIARDLEAGVPAAAVTATVFQVLVGR
jgi:hypothetical protein